jgi:signal transduction histidine kinase
MPVITDRSTARVVEAWRSYDETGQNAIPFNQFVVYAFPVVLLGAIAGGYWLARSSLSPVDGFVRAAREISDRDLSRRLPVDREHDELGRLATTFNDLLARLDVAFRQRDETLAQQRRFVADASHELRTPLTSIQGYARMLDQWALDDPATAREGIAAIGREAARMSQLVDNLLLLARGDETGAVLDLGEHDLNEVVASAVAAARASADGRLSLIEQVFPIPVVARFDRTRIQQVATILLDNAIKFAPPGGTVTISTRTTLDGVELAVADTGPGIAPEDLPHIFERFYRADQSRPTGGAGLGLAIAQQIADRHGGTIRVQSESGRGATFVLALPVERSDA